MSWNCCRFWLDIRKNALNMGVNTHGNRECVESPFLGILKYEFDGSLLGWFRQGYFCCRASCWIKWPPRDPISLWFSKGICPFPQGKPLASKSTFQFSPAAALMPACNKLRKQRLPGTIQPISGPQVNRLLGAAPYPESLCQHVGAQLHASVS